MQYLNFVPLGMAALLLAACNANPAPTAPETSSEPTSARLQAQSTTEPWFLGQWYCVTQDRQLKGLEWRHNGGATFGYVDQNGVWQGTTTYFFKATIRSTSAFSPPGTTLNYQTTTPYQVGAFTVKISNSFAQWTFAPLPEDRMSVTKNDPFRQSGNARVLCFRSQKAALNFYSSPR